LKDRRNVVELLVVFSVLAVVGVLGVIVALALMPFVLQAGILAIASSLLAGGVGEFFGKRRIVLIGCVVLAVVVLFGCMLCAMLVFYIGWRG
jgi:hypothetical protein